MNKVEKNQNYTNQTFEDIKHIDENRIEYWYARELMKVLSYKDWRYFDAVIEKAKIACQNSGISDIDHFVVSNKMVEIGSGAKREQKDYNVEAIVEEKDATFSQKSIKEINSGAYWFKAEVLCELLGKIDNNNAQNEYYLTDTIKLAIDSGLNVNSYVAERPEVVMGANDREQLKELEAAMQSRK